MVPGEIMQMNAFLMYCSNVFFNLHFLYNMTCSNWKQSQPPLHFDDRRVMTSFYFLREYFLLHNIALFNIWNVLNAALATSIRQWNITIVHRCTLLYKVLSNYPSPKTSWFPCPLTPKEMKTKQNIVMWSRDQGVNQKSIQHTLISAPFKVPKVIRYQKSD